MNEKKIKKKRMSKKEKKDSINVPFL